MNDMFNIKMEKPNERTKRIGIKKRRLKEHVNLTINQRMENMLKEMDKYPVDLDTYLQPYLDILDEDTNITMKRVMVVLFMSFLLSQRNVKIDIGKGVLMCNNISIIMAPSGTNKTSSLNTLKQLVGGILDDYTKGHTNTEVSSTNHYMGGGTEAGLTAGIEFADNVDYFSPMWVIDEFADRLTDDPDNLVNMRILAELFPSGELVAEQRKTAQAMRKDIKNVSLNAVIMGAMNRIMEDRVLSKEFNSLMTSKLMRRSFVYYDDGTTPRGDSDASAITTDKRISLLDEARRNLYLTNNNFFGAHSNNEDIPAIKSTNMVCKLSVEAEKVLSLYRKFCQFRGHGQSQLYEADMSGRDMKVLKIAPVHTMLRMGSKLVSGERDVIQPEDIVWAIKYIESLNESVNALIYALERGTNSIMRETIISSLDGISISALKEFSGANSEDVIRKDLLGEYQDGFLYEKDNSIIYEDMSPNEVFYISGKPKGRDDTKQMRAMNSVSGFNYMPFALDKLHDALRGSYDLVMVELKNGERKNGHGGKMVDVVCLDIDYKDALEEEILSREEVHALLGQYKHIVSTSSDKTSNKMKIFIPLMHSLDVSEVKYSEFLMTLESKLHLPKVDKFSEVQLIFTYDNPVLLSNLDVDEAVLLNPYNFIPKHRKSDKERGLGMKEYVPYSTMKINNWNDMFYEVNKKEFEAYLHPETMVNDSLHVELHGRVAFLIQQNFSFDEVFTNMEWVIRVIDKWNIDRHGRKRIQDDWLDRTKKQYANIQNVPSLGVNFTGLSIDKIEQQRKEYNERI